MWMYENNEFNPDQDELKKWAGFVYLITEKKTNMKYIGKKNFWKTRKLKPLKGMKRKRIVTSESDWKNYFGSSENVKQLLEQNGSEAFDKEIIRLCRTKGEMSYFESKIQFDRDVLLRDDYYNGIIHCRINQNTVKHLKELYDT